MIGKELFAEVDQEFGFYPHRFGPYSREFEQNLSRLIDKGYVSEALVRASPDQQPERVRSDFTLLPKGQEEASRIAGDLSEDDRVLLTKYKRLLSNMGFWGLIHYVYSNYPEYTMASEIANVTQQEV